MRITALVGVCATVAATVVGGAGAGADATNGEELVGYAGGSLVRALNNTITSDLTAASSIEGQYENTVTDSAAAISVPHVLTAGAVETATSGKIISGGYEVVSEARTANVNLLGGLITAKALDTVATARLVNGVLTTTSKTTLLGIKIVGHLLPLTIPKNYHVTIPGIASVYLNYTNTAQAGQSAMTIGVGLLVTLLKPQGANSIGAAVLVNPTYAAFGPVTPPPSGHFLYGKSYGTQVTAKVGSLVGVRSDPTAPITLGAAGTDGVTKTSNIAGVTTLSPALRIGAVVDTVNGTNTTSVYDAETTSRVAGLYLLNGLITADAVTADAHVHGSGSLAPSVTGASKLVNLTIAGKAIPISAAKNTVIKLLNIGTVTLNQQVATYGSITVRALDIKLSTAAYGLPAGAEVQVATALARAS